MWLDLLRPFSCEYITGVPTFTPSSSLRLWRKFLRPHSAVMTAYIPYTQSSHVQEADNKIIKYVENNRADTNRIQNICVDGWLAVICIYVLVYVQRDIVPCFLLHLAYLSPK